ncbi:hypothetical protein DVH05_003339 [Phytophthora capsici]|nr:hypothetical protein DVH05_003339 [Phytophthora capsici]
MSMNTLEEIPVVNSVEEANRSRGVNYKTVEYIVLCHAWLSSSRDPVKGVYQTGEDFYDRVKTAFDEELRRMGKTVAERPPTSLNSRF